MNFYSKLLYKNYSNLLATLLHDIYSNFLQCNIYFWVSFPLVWIVNNIFEAPSIILFIFSLKYAGGGVESSWIYQRILFNLPPPNPSTITTQIEWIDHGWLHVCMIKSRCDPGRRHLLHSQRFGQRQGQVPLNGFKMKSLCPKRLKPNASMHRLICSPHGCFDRNDIIRVVLFRMLQPRSNN